MQDQREIGILDQLPEEPISFILFVDEDENRALIVPLAEDLEEPQELGGLLTQFNNLRDILTGLPSKDSEEGLRVVLTLFPRRFLVALLAATLLTSRHSEEMSLRT